MLQGCGDNDPVRHHAESPTPEQNFQRSGPAHKARRYNPPKAPVVPTAPTAPTTVAEPPVKFYTSPVMRCDNCRKIFAMNIKRGVTLQEAMSIPGTHCKFCGVSHQAGGWHVLSDAEQKMYLK